MAEKNKRYYWLKLNENFFEDDTMTWLEEQENGKDYIIFYLKLCLKSLSDDGYLVRYVGEKLIPYDIRALAKITNTSADTVAVAMKTFIDIGLISQYDTGEIYMNQINELIGSETDSAKRMRKKRIMDNKNQLPSQSAHNVQLSDSVVHLSDTEIEEEKELDLDIEQEEEETPAAARDEMESYFGSLTQYMFEDLEFYKDKFDELDAIVIEAIEISRQRSVKNWNYTKKIIQDWRNHNLKTLDAVRKHEAKSKLNNYKPTNQEVDLNTDYEKSLTEKLGF